MGGGFKEEGNTGEDNYSVDVMDWEACKAQEMLPLLGRSMAGWEMVCHQDPNTSYWARMLVPSEEATWLHQDLAMC